MDESNRVLHRSIVAQGYSFIISKGSTGAVQSEISKYLGVDKLDARNILRTLVRLDAVSMFMQDAGKQRVSQ